MLILDTMMEGTVSQNFVLGPRFHFMKCGKLGLKVTLFCDKIKTKTLIKKKLRQGSLHMNVLDMCLKCYHSYLHIKGDITVQKIKVIKQVIYCLLLFTCIDHKISIIR